MAPNKSEKPKRPPTSMIAASMDRKYRQSLCWYAPHNQWLRYSDQQGIWKPKTEDSIHRLIQQELDVHPRVNGYGSSYVASTGKLLKYYLLTEDWATFPHLLGFQNGVLNLETQELHPHSPDHCLTWSLPRNHDAKATAWPKINGWLNEATGGKQDLQQVLLCWLSACLKGRPHIQKYLHLVGPGGTGKGTFFNLAVALIGSENVHSTNLGEWCSNRFESANALGKRVILMPDEDRHYRGISRFKSLTGGDLLRAERKHQEAFSFRFTGLVMVASNYPIFLGEQSSALERRCILIPFEHQVPAYERRNLMADFEPELSALTNYLLNKSDEEIREVLSRSSVQHSRILTWEHRRQTDSILGWLNDHLIPTPMAKTLIGNNKEDATTLFGSFCQWCSRTNHKSVSNTVFSPRLLKLMRYSLKWNVEKGRNGAGNFIQGVKLRSPEDQDPFPIDVLSNGHDPM